MNYSNAYNGVVNDGWAAWRSAWDSTWYIANTPSGVYLFKGVSEGLYSPSEDDQNATDWQHTDQPPRPAQ